MLNESLGDAILIVGFGLDTQCMVVKGGEMSRWSRTLARRSPAEGGDSEIGGDGDGVVMVRSLSTSASGGRDMEAWGGGKETGSSEV
ncbi:hypothetical protein Tco_0281952 [Tanacetum coccineum]